MIVLPAVLEISRGDHLGELAGRQLAVGQGEIPFVEDAGDIPENPVGGRLGGRTQCAAGFKEIALVGIFGQQVGVKAGQPLLPHVA